LLIASPTLFPDTSNDTELEKLTKRLQFVMYCIDCFVSLKERLESHTLGFQKLNTRQLFRPFGRSSVVSQYVLATLADRITDALPRPPVSACRVQLALIPVFMLPFPRCAPDALAASVAGRPALEASVSGGLPR
jgi:hypothetical protein